MPTRTALLLVSKATSVKIGHKDPLYTKNVGEVFGWIKRLEEDNYKRLEGIIGVSISITHFSLKDIDAIISHSFVYRLFCTRLALT